MKKNLILSGAFALLPAILQASSLIVEYSNGSKDTYDLNTVMSIDLSGDQNIKLNKTDGTAPIDTSIASVRMLKFSENTGINNPSATEPTIKVYPNPTSEALVIKGVQSGNLIQLYSIKGKLMKQTTTEDETSTLDISDLNAGTYLLKCGKETVKIIKTK